MNTHQRHEIQQLKRDHSPKDYGEACPVCGDPFAIESSGILFHDEDSSIDVFSWVRLCQGQLPDHYDTDLMQGDGFDPETLTMLYVHKDENLVGGTVTVNRTDYKHMDGPMDGSWDDLNCGCRYSFGRDIGRLYMMPCPSHDSDRNLPEKLFTVIVPQTDDELRAPTGAPINTSQNGNGDSP